MNIFFEIRRRTRAALAPFLLILVIIYFGTSLVQGKRGLIAWLSLTQQNKDAISKLEKLRNQRLENENVIKGLRHSSLDLDLLEEQARKKLGFLHPNDYLVNLKNQ